MSRRKKCLCCDEADCFKFGAYGVIVNDWTMAICGISVYTSFLSDIRINFIIEKDRRDLPSLTELQEDKIIKHYMFINLPLALCLAVKLYYGARWLRYRTLPTLCTFYLNSWTFYTAYVVTESLILITAWHAFTTEYIIIVLTSIVICFTAWFWLYHYVKTSETRNRTMNDYRKQALMKKQHRT